MSAGVRLHMCAADVILQDRVVKVGLIDLQDLAREKVPTNSQSPASKTLYITFSYRLSILLMHLLAVKRNPLAHAVGAQHHEVPPCHVAPCPNACSVVLL